MQSTQISARSEPRQARRFNPVVEFLLSNGINPTRQRVAIANVLYSGSQHVSADAILDRVKEDKTAPYVSKVTVYNTLNLFVKSGILRTLSLGSQRVVFDTNTEPHHHIFNIDTGEIRDIGPETIDLSAVGIPQDHDVLQVDVIIKIKKS